MTVSIVAVKQNHVKISISGALLSLVMTARAIVGHLGPRESRWGILDTLYNINIVKNQAKS